MERGQPNSSIERKVVSLDGSNPVMPDRHEGCIADIRKLLEMAESGEVVGVALVKMHRDRTCSYTVSGMAGGFSMLGGLEMVKVEITRINFEFDR